MLRDDLERALADEFDADHLSVYGDYLQSLGDPRGELIALDLSGRDDGRRDQLIAEWLGADVADQLAMTAVEHGFITDLYLDGADPRSPRLLEAILAGPGAPYIRGATILGDAAWAQTALAQLAARPKLWLQRLSVQTSGDEATPAVAAELAAALVRATPRLEQLEVWGRHVFHGFGHPALRSLRVTGHDAVDALLVTGTAELPAVTVLDLAFCVEGDRPVASHQRRLASLCGADRLPRLRRLDLSRNEPGTQAPHYLGGRSDAFAFLARLAVRHQLTHVRLPSVRSQGQADRLAAALADMPALREIAVVRGYRAFSHVTVPARVELPEPWPWRPADMFHEVIAARVRSVPLDHAVLARAPAFALSLTPIVAWFEQHLDDMPPATRAAWSDLFELLDKHPGVELQIPRRAIRPMLDALDDGLDAWIRLRDAIRVFDHESLSVVFER